MKINFKFLLTLMSFTFVLLGSSLVPSLLGPQFLFASTIRGSVQSESGEPLREAVIYIARIDRTDGKQFASPEHHPTIDQKGRRFIPHVLPIVAGTKVDFLNHDPEFHNVHSFSEAKAFNITLPGVAKSVKQIHFPKTGEVLLLCDIHSAMRAYILVLQNSYFAVSNEKGEYALPYLPADTYTLVAWHEHFAGQPKEIRVFEENNLLVSFTLKPKSTPVRNPLQKKPEERKPWTWEQVIEQVQETLFQALSVARDHKEAEAKKLCSDAYFAYFEAKGMETAIRQNISSRRAFEIEEMFSHLRKEMAIVASDEKEAKEAEKTIQALIAALRKEATELLAQGILGEDWDKADLPLQPTVATNAPKPQGTPAADISSQIVHNIERAFAKARAAYVSGNVQGAEDIVTDVYFDEFHRIEADIAVVSPAGVQEIEGAFAHLRGLIQTRTPKEEVENAMRQLTGQLNMAIAEMAASRGSLWMLFFQAFLIILREGAEAILIVGAIVTYLARTGSQSLARVVYTGGGLALLASLLTAIFVQAFFHTSFSGQEIIEGLTLLLASAVLFYVSYWFISKAEADRWQRFVQGKIAASLSKGSRFTLGGAAFLAVYREGAETVLFYQALLSGAQEGRIVVLPGFLLGLVALVGIFLVFRYASVKLPIRPFFATTSLILYTLAFVFAGQGIAELQESGFLAITPLKEIPRVPTLGIYPTVETLLLQGLFVVAACVALGFLVVRNRKAVSPEVAS